MSYPSSLQWALAYLPDYFSDPPAPFHAELMADFENPELRLVARVAPRGHAKSTCAAFAYPLWCICQRRKRNIVIITHESSLATQFVRDLREELVSNERIRENYGDLTVGADAEADTYCAADSVATTTNTGDGPESHAPRTARKTHGKSRAAAKPKSPPGKRLKWSESKFTLAGGITVQAKGRGASLRGVRVGPYRPDLIVCDDIEKDEDVANPEGRRKLEHWLRRVVMPALAPDGQLLVLGSLLHYDSLLANLREPRRFPKWDYKVYRAIECERAADNEFYQVSLWPARWPLAKLEEERHRIGTLAFEHEYQANPIDDSVRVFLPEWLNGYAPGEINRIRLITLMAVDPATGADGGDYFALWIGGIDPGSGVIYTRELSLERIGIVEQIKRVIAAFNRWKPVKIGIETTAYQVALKQMLDDYGRKQRLYLPIVPIRTHANKRARIEGSAAFYENGTFRLPAGLPPEVQGQFLHFPKAKHDDAPDVCAMGLELARELSDTLDFEGAAKIGREHRPERKW